MPDAFLHTKGGKQAGSAGFQQGTYAENQQSKSKQTQQDRPGTPARNFANRQKILIDPGGGSGMDVHEIDPESQRGQKPDQSLATTNPNGPEQQKAADGVDQNERGIIVLTEKLIGQIVPAVQLQ